MLCTDVDIRQVGFVAALLGECILSVWYTASLLHDHISAQTPFTVAHCHTPMLQIGFGGVEIFLPLQTLCVTPGQESLRGIQAYLMDTESKFIPSFQAQFFSTPLLLLK